MISVIDYGMGNIKSVSKALEAVGAQIKITQNPEDIKKIKSYCSSWSWSFP